MTDDLSGNKLKRRREEGSQTDEDLSGHCCDSSLAEQVAEINSKLDKLLKCHYDQNFPLPFLFTFGNQKYETLTMPSFIAQEV